MGIKYLEVETALLNDNVVLTGGVFKLKGTSNDVRKLCREMLVVWGSMNSSTEFIDKFLLASLPKSDQLFFDLLPQFFKQTGLVGDFARELSSAFESFQPARYMDCNEKLKTFLAGCGEGVSQVANLRTWIELMSVTGILHGSTMSFTRLLLTSEIMKRVNPKSDKYELTDAFLAALGSATIIGVVEDRHVFSAGLDMTSFRKAVADFPPFDPVAFQVRPRHKSLLLCFNTFVLYFNAFVHARSCNRTMQNPPS